MVNDPKPEAPMTRIKKIGEGSYGIVYSGKFKKDPSKTLAIKRNFKEKTASWIGNIHEADVLARLKGHPCIVELRGVSFEDPFDEDKPMTPTAGEKKKMIDDKIHFILEYADTCGDGYLKSSKFNYGNSCIILAQVIVGLKYMHVRNIIHRDLKPANILIKYENDVPYAKICDFGMACNYSKCTPGTPGVVTCWYRAPEICFGVPDYDCKSDIWSFGCLLFEFISGKPWLNTKDNDSDIINAIIHKLTTDTPEIDEDIEYLKAKAKGSRKNLKIKMRDYMNGMKMSLRSQIHITEPAMVAEFEKRFCTIDELLELIKGCLQINPNKRFTVDQIINHKFFQTYSDYIESLQYSINPNPNVQIQITRCIERIWAFNELIEIYNNRNNYVVWYKDVILFHSIDLFDMYTTWVFSENNNKINIREEETSDHGKIHNKLETRVRFWTCLYIMHKYYSTLVHPEKWTDFFPKDLHKYGADAERFEYIMIKYVTNYIVFRDTLIEMIDKYDDNPTEDLIGKLMTGYMETNDYVGTVSYLYNQILERKPTIHSHDSDMEDEE